MEERSKERQGIWMKNLMYNPAVILKDVAYQRSYQEKSRTATPFLRTPTVNHVLYTISQSFGFQVRLIHELAGLLHI